MQMLPRDVILALILADLPIDLDREYDVEVVEGRGASWWYVVSECDDFHVDVVEHIIASVSYSQAQALCLVKGPSGESILERATPECRSVLQASLRLMGRFELADRTALFTDSVHGLKVFNAFDFGDGIDAEPKRVLLKTYSDRKAFEREVRMHWRQVVGMLYLHRTLTRYVLSRAVVHAWTSFRLSVCGGNH